VVVVVVIVVVVVVVVVVVAVAAVVIILDVTSYTFQYRIKRTGCAVYVAQIYR
jgi:hypothetical protein